MGAVGGRAIPDIPEDLYYSATHEVWLRREADDLVCLGLTAAAAAKIGMVVACTPKRVGKHVKKDKSCATIESGHWVGPAKTPIAGTIACANEAVATDPALISHDPYGAGWLVKIVPDDWSAQAKALLTGVEAITAIERQQHHDGFVHD